jgi:hypothetical protein
MGNENWRALDVTSGGHTGELYDGSDRSSEWLAVPGSTRSGTEDLRRPLAEFVPIGTTC